jgi:hypothetical protein
LYFNADWMLKAHFNIFVFNVLKALFWFIWQLDVRYIFKDLLFFMLPFICHALWIFVPPCVGHVIYWLLLIKTAPCCRIIVSQSWLTCCCLCYFSYHVAASFHSNRLLLLCDVFSMLVSLMILQQHNPPSRAKVEMLKTSNILYIIYAYCIIKSPDCHP